MIILIILEILILNTSNIHLGFLQILRIRFGFKFNSIIIRKSKIVSDNCPNYYPCYKEDTSIQSFTHWIFSCKNFGYERDDYLDFIDSPCIHVTLINEQKSLNLSLDSEKDGKDNVKFF